MRTDGLISPIFLVISPIKIDKPMLMIRLFNRNIQKLFTLRYNKFDYFSKFPAEQQALVLKELVRSARNTEYGRKYGFKVGCRVALAIWSV